MNNANTQPSEVSNETEHHSAAVDAIRSLSNQFDAGIHEMTFIAESTKASMRRVSQVFFDRYYNLTSNRNWCLLNSRAWCIFGSIFMAYR
jgi:hypothetical protein